MPTYASAVVDASDSSDQFIGDERASPYAGIPRPGRMRPLAPEVLYYCSHGTGWYLRDVFLSEISPLPVPRARTICAAESDTGCLSAFAADLYVCMYVYSIYIETSTWVARSPRRERSETRIGEAGKAQGILPLNIDSGVDARPQI